MSRQNYYARHRHRQRRQVEEDLICQLVRGERQRQPRLGTRKLRVLLAAALQEAGVRLGRDRLFELLRQAGLLVKPKSRVYPRTTHSCHSLPVFGNLVKDLPLSRPNQVWVADLTYLRTEEGFMFLALVTDKMSRHIVGYDCSDSLESIGCQRALRRALRELPAGEQPIHHSDRGSQYCCHEYVKLATGGGLTMSMTETDHCAENALAERVNGILKGEYGLDQCYKTKALLQQAVEEAVGLYGTRRPHSALGHQFPAVVHRQLLPPDPPPAGCPATGTLRARPEPRTGVRRSAQVGAIPVADQPVEPLRGQGRVVTSASRK
jgi:transposase InsO family protein